MKHWAPALLLLAACGVPEGSENVLVFGHGGMGPDHPWPMDSRESIEACFSSGADGVEMDVHLTSDSVLVAYHDEDLSSHTDCHGHVNANRWKDLRDCTYPAFTVEVEGSALTRRPRLVRVDSVLGYWRDWQQLTLDCKLFAAGEWSTYLSAYVHALDTFIAEHRLHGRVNIECMDVGFLDRVKTVVRGGAAFLYATDAEAGIDTARAHGYHGITIDRRLISAEQVKAAHDAGLKVAVFGADGAWSHRSALSLRADMIQTDEPAGLLKLLGR